MSSIEPIRAWVQQAVAGRPWICVADVLVAAAAHAKILKSLRADRVLAIGGTRGTGVLPEPEELLQIVLNTGGDDMMGMIRASEKALAAVPPEVQAQIDAFDPRGEARVVGPLYSAGAAVGGRRIWGARPASWLALEDKTVVDALWDAAGVERAQAAVTTPHFAALSTAAAPLDAGDGTVWSGDAREGFNGGASFVRWVRTEAEGRAAAAFFAAHCDRVRVMPFLAGIPCSMHGFVFEDQVLALRPCEMLVFQVPGESRFAYSGAGTFWDPPDADREAMRGAIRRVGSLLRATVGYRGAFTVDGVMTSRGFRPTELNPRFGAALGILGAALPDLPLYLLHLGLVEGLPVTFDPRDLEDLLVTVSDHYRRGSGQQWVTERVSQNDTLSLVLAEGTWRLAAYQEPAHAIVQRGPSAMGGLVRVTLVPEFTPVGSSAAPRLADVFAFAERHWHLGLSVLVPACEVRSSAETCSQPLGASSGELRGPGVMPVAHWARLGVAGRRSDIRLDIG